MTATDGPLGVDRALVAGQIIPGDVETRDGRIVDVGRPIDGSGHTAVAGFVDLQVNGFAGVDFSDADPSGYRTAAAAMAATGVTSFQPTFITLPWNAYSDALTVAAAVMVDTPGMMGIHLEGPFLATTRCGAHDPADIVPPTLDRVESLTTAPVSWITLAPEVDGALDAIERFVRAGIRVAIGHSDASAEITHRAAAAGATCVTHLFNAQSPLHHRAPGVPGAALDDERLAVSVIVDGHHLADDLVRLVFRAAGERTALITDAIAATMLGEGPVALGTRDVVVTDGRAELEDGTLAGSVLTMDAAVRNVVDIGIDEVAALMSATAVPARLAGLDRRGDLSPGSDADVVVLDGDLSVVRTMRAGEEIHHR